MAAIWTVVDWLTTSIASTRSVKMCTSVASPCAASLPSNDLDVTFRQSQSRQLRSSEEHRLVGLRRLGHVIVDAVEVQSQRR